MPVDLSATRQRFYLETAFSLQKFGETVQVFLPGISTVGSGFVYATPTGECYATPTGECYGIRGGYEMDCHVQENFDVDGEGDSYELVQQILLSCHRDPAATNSEGRVIGGIEYPEPGLRILRSTARDPVQLAYHYVDTAEAESLYRWKLRFERKLERSAGAGVN